MPFSWNTQGGGASPWGGTSTPTAPAAPTKSASAISLEKMLAEAARLAGVEDSRHATEYGRLDQAGKDFNKGFEADESKLTSLSTGAAFDSAGQGALDQTRQLRSSLGGRGIDPSSGTAAALANRVSMQKETLKYGALRNAAIDSAGRRNANRAATYAQQLNLAQFGNQSPSMIQLDSLTNKAEFDLASETADKQLAAAKYSAKKGAQAAKTSAIGGIIGSVLGGL